MTALAIPQQTTGAAVQPPSRRVLALQVIFVVSGFCGLIYESIWSHYLKLFVGHAAYAQTVVLVVFIGGMALGATLVGRFAERLSAPLLAYAVVEGVIGLISLGFHGMFVGATEWAYASLLPMACSPESPCAAQWMLAAALILPQSVLLGTTFPLMTAGVLRLAPQKPGASIALFYFLNSMGAVLGVLASAFILIPAMGLPGALFTAGLLNIAVALGAYACWKGTTASPPTYAAAETQRDETPRLRHLLLLVAALTGLSSFVYEIVWIRMLSLVIGASTDAFELMLAAFILGLALGGLWVRTRIDRFRDLVHTLAVVQVLMGILAVATLPLYDRTFDLLAWLLGALNRSEGGYALYNVASHAIALAIMLPATFLAGMTLPLITTTLLRGSQGERAIGYVYGANTLGAIVGVILAVHVAMPMLGVKGGLLLGAAIDVGLALLLFAYNAARRADRSPAAWSAAGILALAAVALLVPVATDRLASGVYRKGQARLPETATVVFHREGKTANVNVLRNAGILSIHTNGKSDAGISTDPAQPTADEYTMAFAAVLPLALKPSIEHAAVIGFGSGMTTATLLGSPRVKRVTTIEIEPEMVNGARLFGSVVAPAFEDPRSAVVIDDAKSYFARSSVRYDLIVSEPSNPWVSGVASLFTVEFYKRVRQQLADDGLFLQWVQGYEFSNELMGTILRALDAQFADYALYLANDTDMMIVASNRALPEVADDFTRFADLQPTLRRLALNGREEIEVRRVAGPRTVRALLSRMTPGVNSDFFPLVDVGAPRERFLRAQADAFRTLAVAAVPVVEVVEGRQGVSAGAIPWGGGFHERRAAVQSARATAQWLLQSDAAESSPAPLPRDLGMLRAALWNCAPLPPRIRVRELMYEVAAYVNPHLSPKEAAAVWNALATAPCAGKLPADDRAWLQLFTATGARNAEAMATLGSSLALAASEPAHLRAYAALAGSTGFIATRRHHEAVDLLGRASAKLPASITGQSVFQVLRGYASTPAR